MKNIKIILLFIFLAGILSTCKKSVNDGYEEYIGEWYVDNQCEFYLKIDETSYGEYKYLIQEDMCKDNGKGKVKIGKNRIKIGWSSFKILESPTIIPDTVIIIDFDSIKTNYRMRLQKGIITLGSHGTTFYKKKY